MANSLLADVVKNTGLPPEGVHKELSQILQKSGLNESELTLEQLREMVAEYLQDVFLMLSEEQKN